MMRRIKDIECEKCGHEFSTTEHTQCPQCKESACENCGDVEKLEYHEWDQGNECGYLCEACIIQTEEKETDDV